MIKSIRIWVKVWNAKKQKFDRIEIDPKTNKPLKNKGLKK